ncbi:chromosome partitioning protein [Dactylosporangium sp. NPDC049140]|jgi:hypothetical protein|uniref:chromosome partitioning protein n=1 Tax=Dactylosporangium sp. NPDC049140 TaxID=3155647 RepID=UPI003405E234
MPGLELAAGLIAAWAIRKGRRAAGRLDGTVDVAMDASLERLDDLVREKLGGEPALGRLDEEAARGEVQERTATRVQLAVEDAAEFDAQFRAGLAAALREAARHGAGPAVITQTITASGDAVVNVVGQGNQYHLGGGRG